MNDEHTFIVASRGLTATTWLAQTLNAHPSIFCSHGRDRPERGPETPELLQSKSYRDDRLEFERLQRSMSIVEYLAAVRRASNDEPIIGNVHGFILVELLDKLDRAGLYGTFPIANMVRNPLTFVESYTALVCHRKDDYPEKWRAEHQPRADANRDLIESFSGSELPELEILGFIEACQALVKMGDELGLADIPVIVMEKIVSDRAYLRESAKFLTQGRCEFSDEMLQPFFSRSPMNSHRNKVSESRSARESAREGTVGIWEGFSETKKKIFKTIVQDNHIRPFVSIGYDLAFLLAARN